jgi:hypothetical protein
MEEEPEEGQTSFRPPAVVVIVAPGIDENQPTRALMNLHTSLALACVLALTGCKKEPRTSPQPPKAQPAKTPTRAAKAPAKASPKLPTAAELIALIDKATRIEAKSAKWKKKKWSKDLTKADIANLKAGIGEAKKISGSIPRCAPSVVVILYQQKKELATLGLLCGRTGTMRFDINKTLGSFIPQDKAKVNAALKSPVDK